MSQGPASLAPLWPYALELYSRPGVEPLLVELQDGHRQCAPLLIWVLWMHARGRTPGALLLGQAAELARAWEGVAVAPLRRLRRELKGAPRARGRAGERIRQGVKTLEIESERMMLQMLEELGDAEPGATDAQAALRSAAVHFGGAPDSLVDRLAELAA